MEEDDMVMRVGSSLRMRGERDEPMRREGLQARGIYKEVPRPSRGLALAATKRSLTPSYSRNVSVKHSIDKFRRFDQILPNSTSLIDFY